MTLEEDAAREADKKGLTGDERERYIGGAINRALHPLYRRVDGKKPGKPRYGSEEELQKAHERQEVEKRMEIAKRLKARGVEPPKPKETWAEKYATKNTPHDPEERRKWYARQYEEAPYKLDVQRTNGTGYRLPFATKAEAEKALRDAGTEDYRATLNGQAYERTKNYGWRKK